ncbi:MAG: diaminopimelate epimerase, partial [Caldiserica bacterium]
YRKIKKPSVFAKKVCMRKFGIGADGLLLLEKEKGFDFKMRIFNSDGSEAEMCGNGARCVAYYSYKNGISKRIMKFSTIGGEIEAEVRGKRVKVKLTPPKNYKVLRIKVDGKIFKVYFVLVGVPHAVLFFDNLEKVDVRELGKKIRYHPVFLPKGTNVDFVKITGKSSISIRTYERGVEDETLSCGTGSVASAYISWRNGFVSSRVKVKTRAEDLRVYIEDDKNVYLEGKVEHIYDGTFFAFPEKRKK